MPLSSMQRCAEFRIDYELPYDVSSSPGSCGDYLPENSVFNRFIWQIGFLARNGFYILIDNRACLLTQRLSNWTYGEQLLFNSSSFYILDQLVQPDVHYVTCILDAFDALDWLIVRFIVMWHISYLPRPQWLLQVERQPCVPAHC